MVLENMITKTYLGRGKDRTQSDADSDFGDIEQESESDLTNEAGPLSKLLGLTEENSQQTIYKPPEESVKHSISQHPRSTSNKQYTNAPILSARTFDITDAITEHPAVVINSSVVGVDVDWIKQGLVLAFPVLLLVFAAMLTYFMIQFCLNKSSLIKSDKKKKQKSQSKKNSQQAFESPPQVSVVRPNGTGASPATQAWARKSISASRQCAIDIDESSNDSEASASSVDEKTKRAPKSLGSIKYRLTYDFGQSVFAVSVLEAKGLPAMDLCGTSDPYVKVYFIPDEGRPIQKTKVKKRNLNPVFDETFEFNISYPQLVSKTLMLAVYDYDRFSRHDEIGQVSLPMNTVELAETTERWQPLERLLGSGGEKLGDLCLGLRYVPNSGKLTVIVMEARGLKKMDLGGLSDPFVKLALYIDGKRVKKKKTEIKKCTLNPQFNESFSFEVSPEQMQTAQIRFTVIDYDRIGVSEPIGSLVLACAGAASGDTESRHWTDMLASPRRQISRWHSLLPYLR